VAAIASLQHCNHPGPPAMHGNAAMLHCTIAQAIRKNTVNLSQVLALSLSL
jgi:hypothetical protein